jgi:hypothetical protein
MPHSFSAFEHRAAAAQVIDSLKLDERASIEDCAIARNEYARQRLLKDFYDGICEMRHNGGRAPDTTGLKCAKASVSLEPMGCRETQDLRNWTKLRCNPVFL